VVTTTTTRERNYASLKRVLSFVLQTAASEVAEFDAVSAQATLGRLLCARQDFALARPHIGWRPKSCWWPATLSGTSSCEAQYLRSSPRAENCTAGICRGLLVTTVLPQSMEREPWTQNRPRRSSGGGKATLQPANHPMFPVWFSRAGATESLTTFPNAPF